MKPALSQTRDARELSSFGGAAMCAWEATREEPRWERAIGYGTAGGAAIGTLILLSDILSAW